MSGHFIYWIVFGLLVIGLYVMITHGNLVKKLIGLNVFQGAVFMLVISLGYVRSGEPPIIEDGVQSYSHPLPHVLILTAIVVGVASTALGVALAVRIYRAFGTIEEDEALEADRKELRKDGGRARP